MSSYVEWADSLSVGVPEIDEQHGKMLGIINQAFEEVTHRDNQEALKGLVAALMEYAQEHFVTEEDLMRSCNYERLAAHQQEHIHFMEKMRDFALSLDQGASAPMLPLEMFHFLQTWLAEHIIREDKAYAACLATLKQE